ncbi:MAG: UDP-2,3-diacylglucosamine diphosphatase [Planctomycetota bacterium]|nr:MAG: UDP-2,3-diacylglucosamine diphosphatase [Planctomycetota bacterium]
MTKPAPVVRLRPSERVWVTGDVHLAPGDEGRVRFFLDFLAAARTEADRLVVLGDLFDYWIGARHAEACAYRPVLAALRAATSEGFPVDFVPGNRDFLGPDELESVGLSVYGDRVVYEREGVRTLVTHGDLLVSGDRSYQRYRRVVRSGCFSLLYGIVPVAVRVFVAERLRGVSQRKLGKVEPYAFAVDVRKSEAWLRAHDAQEVLMGHLHREEVHAHPGERRTRMLPGWSDGRAPYFELGPAAVLRFYPD